MGVLAIDPGTHESAWVLLERGGKLAQFAKEGNSVLLHRLRYSPLHQAESVVIEQIASYGMPVGAEVFHTCFWVGRFLEAAKIFRRVLMVRREVKLFLCGSMKANDAAIRQRIIDIYGPGREKAIGKKNSPGPLYGVSADVWQALALGMTFQGGIVGTKVED